MDAVAGLMLERQRVEAWIAALEAKRAITPPHVYERVRGDYEKRLREIMAQLSGRSTEVQQTIASLTERLVRMQSEETKLREQRYERELRAAVGEFPPDQWKEYLRTSEEALARITRERGAISAEIARLQQILSMAGATPGRGMPATDGAGHRRSSSGGVAEPLRGQPGFDELAFLQSVTDPQSPNGTEPPSPSTGGAPPGALSGLPLLPTAPPMSPGRRTSGGGTQPPTRTSLPQTRSSAPQPRSSSPQPRPSQPRPSQPTTPSPPGGKILDNTNRQVTETGEVPAFLKDVPQEQTRTLKCASCGSMNFPTEWYCERCGSDLAQM